MAALARLGYHSLCRLNHGLQRSFLFRKELPFRPNVPFWVLIAAVVVLFIVANDPALKSGICPFLLLRTQRIYLPVLSLVHRAR